MPRLLAPLLLVLIVVLSVSAPAVLLAAEKAPWTSALRQIDTLRAKLDAGPAQAALDALPVPSGSPLRPRTVIDDVQAGWRAEVALLAGRGSPAPSLPWRWAGPLAHQEGVAFSPWTPEARDVALGAAPRAPAHGRDGPLSWQPLPPTLRQDANRSVAAPLPLEHLIDDPDDAMLVLAGWWYAPRGGRFLLRVTHRGPVRVVLGGAVRGASSGGAALRDGDLAAAAWTLPARGAPARGLADRPGVIVALDERALQLPAKAWVPVLVKVAPADGQLPLDLALVDARGRALGADVVRWAASPPGAAAKVGRARWTGPGRSRLAGLETDLPELSAALALLGQQLDVGLLDMLRKADPEALTAASSRAPLRPSGRSAVAVSASLIAAHADLGAVPGERLMRLQSWRRALGDAAVGMPWFEAMLRTGHATRALGALRRRQPWDLAQLEATPRGCALHARLWLAAGGRAAAWAVLRRCQRGFGAASALFDVRERLVRGADDLQGLRALADDASAAWPGARWPALLGLEARAALGRPALEPWVAALPAALRGASAFALSRAALALERGALKTAAAALDGIAPVWCRRRCTTLRARLAEQRGDLDTARTLLRTAVRAAPTRADLRARLDRLDVGERFFDRGQPDLQALAARAQAGGEAPEATQVLLRRTWFRLRGDGRHARYELQVVHIGRDTTGSWQTSVDYVPTQAIAGLVDAWVRRPDGALDRRVQQTTEQTSEAGDALYYDLETLNAGFDGLHAGDVVVVAHLVRDTVPSPFGLVFGELVSFADVDPVARHDVLVTMPASMTLTAALGGPGRPAARLDTSKLRAEDDGSATWSHTVGPIAAVQVEEAMPGVSELAPYLHLSAFTDWRAVEAWYQRLLARALPTASDRPALQQIAKRLRRRAGGADADAAALVEQAYRFVADEIRYVGLEFGVHSLQPYPVRDVLRRGFGDCKDKATLLVSLLAELGVPAEVVLVRTHAQGRLRDPIASLAVFDHAIAHVPSLGLWLDATVRHYPAGLLPAEDVGADVLRVGAGLGRLVQPPAPPCATHRRDEQLRFALQPDGDARLEGTWRLDGLLAANARSAWSDPAARREQIADALTARYGQLDLRTLDVDGLSPPTGPLIVRFSATLVGWGLELETVDAPPPPGQVANELRPLRPPRSLLRAWAAEPSRTHPVVFGHPWQQRVDVRLSSPPPWRLVIDAAREQASAGADRFSLVAAPGTGAGADRDVTLRLELNRCERAVAPADYQRFRRWAAQLDTALQRAVRVVREAP